MGETICLLGFSEDLRKENGLTQLCVSFFENKVTQTKQEGVEKVVEVVCMHAAATMTGSSS